MLFKSPPKWWIQWHSVFGNTFSEIHAPQNLDIESKLKALRLLVSEIDHVLHCKWPPFCINDLQNGEYNGTMYSAMLFLKSTPQKTYSSSFVSFTRWSPTCGRMPLPSLSLRPGRQPYTPRLVGDRRGGGPSSVAPAVAIHRLGIVELAPSPPHCFCTANPCAQSVNSSPTEPVLSRSSWQRLGYL